jgi:ATP-dependent Clp protease ATP-binding subunit ClpA
MNDLMDDEDRMTSKTQKTSSNGGTPVLDNFSRDLNKLAEQGKLDPVIGRESEILRIAQILSRRKKNNPIIIGEPGCVLGDTIIEIEKVSEVSSHNIELM